MVPVKRDLVDALFQYWQKHQGDREAQLIVRHARELVREDINKLDKMSGWFVIEDIECLDEQVQLDLAAWLSRHPGESTSLDSNVRLVSLSSLSQKQLSNGETLNKTLYFALATLALAMPSLRDRKEDIEGLIQQVISAQAKRYRLPSTFYFKRRFNQVGFIFLAG